MRIAIEQLVSNFRALSAPRRGFLLVLAVAASFLVLALWTHPATKLAIVPSSEFPSMENPARAPQTDRDFLVDDKQLEESRTNLSAPGVPQPRAAGETGGALPYATPLIAHAAELAVATKEFAKSRSELEEILERHRGYAAKLRMVGRRTGSVLSATLRVPAPELGSSVSDLKSLGDVEQEEQSADEVTQQRADLEARLSNAQNTQRRLQELLKKQTYPDGNVRELQRQIANVSAEINRLEAERQASDRRIVFANVQFSLREVVSAPTESLSARLHNAASTGFGEAAASISSLLLFFIGRGPIVLLWMAILFVPARLVWKRWQPAEVQATAPAQAD